MSAAKDGRGAALSLVPRVGAADGDAAGAAMPKENPARTGAVEPAPADGAAAVALAGATG